MNITFHGAAETVTGSKHLIQTDRFKILLDCGMFQGHGAESDELNRHLGFDPRSIDALLLSHAHIDHAGLIPALVAQGFRGPIFCTPATKDLCKIMLEDSAHIQESDIRYLNKRRVARGEKPLKPLYTTDDVFNCLKYFKVIAYDKKTEILDGVSVIFTDAGHILGSAMVNVEIQENNQIKKITFTGDIGRQNPRIIRKPQPFPQCDILITESTYGDKLHDEETHSIDELLRIVIETCVMKKGKLIIPAFSVGRTQEVVYALDRLQSEGRLPDIPVFVDSPLSTSATEIMRSHPECFNEDVQEYLKSDPDPFGFHKLQYIRDVSKSKELNHLKTPAIIISASGMAEAGRIKHHIANNIGKPSTTILIVGHCEEGSLGYRLTRGDERVKIFGELYDRRAHIEVMGSFSAHGDYQEMIQALSCINPQLVQHTFLVHGDKEVLPVWKSRLKGEGFNNITIAEKGKTYSI
ncbi:MAG: MBL fold metallo-hydrolase [Bacteroidetes bacterium]|nr:MBL fold metallo-hydrolase [Bacteroidota bacterium]